MIIFARKHFQWLKIKYENIKSISNPSFSSVDMNSFNGRHPVDASWAQVLVGLSIQHGVLQPMLWFFSLPPHVWGFHNKSKKALFQLLRHRHKSHKNKEGFIITLNIKKEMCLLITNLVSPAIRIAFAFCNLLGQYWQFLSKTGGKNVQLARRSLGEKEGKSPWKTEQSSQRGERHSAPQWSIEHLLSAYKMISH